MYLLHLVYNTHIITAQMIYVFGILLHINIEVYENGATPKSSIFSGIVHEMNHPAIGDPPFMETPRSRSMRTRPCSRAGRSKQSAGRCDTWAGLNSTTVGFMVDIKSTQ